jgi:hypothetical protein
LDKFLKELVVYIPGLPKFKIQKMKLFLGVSIARSQKNPKNNPQKKKKRNEGGGGGGVTIIYLVPSCQKNGRIIKYFFFV